METLWRPIPGWEESYEASSDGKIRSKDRVQKNGRFRRGAVLSPSVDKSGYLRLILYMDGRATCCAVHRLVCLAFYGAPPEGAVVAHANGVRQDNRVENLRWATYKENAEDALAHGTRVHGERHFCAKLSDRQVCEIRASQLKPPEIARVYEISESHAYRIVSNRTRRYASVA